MSKSTVETIARVLKVLVTVTFVCNLIALPLVPGLAATEVPPLHHRRHPAAAEYQLPGHHQPHIPAAQDHGAPAHGPSLQIHQPLSLPGGEDPRRTGARHRQGPDWGLPAPGRQYQLPEGEAEQPGFTPGEEGGAVPAHRQHRCAGE